MGLFGDIFDNQSQGSYDFKRLRRDLENEYAVISVSDHGTGISDEEKEKVFDMFYTGGSRSSDSRRSLALGLALCRSIISSHGGTISVSDNIPNGTVVSFTLPIGEVDLNE